MRRVNRRSRSIAIAGAMLAAMASGFLSSNTLPQQATHCGAPLSLVDHDIDLDSLARLSSKREGEERMRARRLGHLARTLYQAELTGGTGERMSCLGRGETLRDITWLFDLEQLERVDLARGASIITAVEARHTVLTDDIDDRRVDETEASVVIDLPAVTEWRTDASLGSISAHARFRRAGSSRVTCQIAVPCSQAVDVVLSARVVDTRIELEQRSFVAGLLSERVIWTFDAVR